MTHWHPPSSIARALQAYQPSSGSGGFLVRAQREFAPYLSNPPFSVGCDVHS